jgi:hypothetical protein
VVHKNIFVLQICSNFVSLEVYSYNTVLAVGKRIMNLQNEGFLTLAALFGAHSNLSLILSFS